jgi:fermentation-respiration switch protein FrsA (DUF1100 family)
MNGVLIETGAVGAIPVLTFAPRDAAGCPVVLLIPGFGGRKEDGLALGAQLAQAGMFAISFDPWLHGARSEPLRDNAADPAHGGVYPPETGLDTGVVFFRVIGQCLHDARALLEHYADDPRADVGRCGVTGLSMGGYASYLVFARVPAVRAAVPMVGIPQFGRRWRDLLDECAFSNPDWAAALAGLGAPIREHTGLIDAIDPFEALKRAAPRALLMMNCDFDFDQPKLYAVMGYRELQAAYAGQPDRLRLRIYPAGHTVTPEMQRDAVGWFREHL